MNILKVAESEYRHAVVPRARFGVLKLPICVKIRQHLTVFIRLHAERVQTGIRRVDIRNQRYSKSSFGFAPFPDPLLYR